MAKILEVTMKMQVSDDELSNLLARLGEGSVSTVSAVDTGTGEITEAVAPAAPADAGDKPKGKPGRPKKNADAPAAPAVAAAPPAAPVAMPTMPAAPVAMPTMPAAPVAPPPVSYEQMAGAYEQKATEGKIAADHLFAKYAEFGITDPTTQLQTDESARRKIYDWLVSL